MDNDEKTATEGLTPTTPAVDFMTAWVNENKERKRKAKEYLLSLTPILRQNGIGFVVGFFDGSGDSGQVEQIKFYPPQDADNFYGVRGSYDQDALGGEVEQPVTIGQDDLDYAISDLCPDGYENNAGGFGAAIFNVEEGTIKVNFSYRIEETESADYEV